MAGNISGRALHYVMKIADRRKNVEFFRDILGMKVLRHEEFQEACDAECNRPYDKRWSKTMMGYGPESNHFVIELNYNYGIKKYEMGNDFGGITIRSKAVIDRAKQQNYPMSSSSKNSNEILLLSPGGYNFNIINEEENEKSDPIIEVKINVTNIEKSRYFWHDVLGMIVAAEDDKFIRLSYGENQACLCLHQISGNLNRAEAYGRIVFAVPKMEQDIIDDAVTASNGIILTPLSSLETPGKATVRVIVLADPDGHEICFVDEEGFEKLSTEEEDGDQRLDRNIQNDPFQ